MKAMAMDGVSAHGGGKCTWRSLRRAGRAAQGVAPAAAAQWCYSAAQPTPACG